MSLTYDEAGHEKAGMFARIFHRFRWFWALRRWHQRSRRLHRIIGHEWRVGGYGPPPIERMQYCPCGEKQYEYPSGMFHRQKPETRRPA